MIYIACPAYNATGGTELLHQLHFHLNMLKIDSRIYYTNKLWYRPFYTNKKFSKYKIKSTSKISDKNENILISAETNVTVLKKYVHINKILWWLSVNNYFNARDGKQVDIEKHSFSNNEIIFFKSLRLNLIQSYYAENILKKHNIINNVKYLSDYINEDYLCCNTFIDERQDIILFNPNKGYEILSEVINKLPKYKWIPIIGYENNELVKLFSSAKLYIDFGPHPGKDRIPREACILGCCVITNKEGSANFEQDVSIPEMYKFQNPLKSINELDQLILEIFENFEIKYKDFEDYRRKIRNEKSTFLFEIHEIFSRDRNTSSFCDTSNI
jgi:hypothetical protein